MAERRETIVKTEIELVTATTTGEIDNLIEKIGGSSKNKLKDIESAEDQDKNKNQVHKPEDAECKDDFQKKALERHNHHRKKHGVPPLKWCSKCAAQAQKWADEIASSSNFAHSNEKGFGENLFTASSSEGAKPDADKAIDAWFDEIKDFKFGEESPSNLSQVGHFTQVVWKATTHVGMAYAVKGDTVYVVANYLPAGNMLGKFHENVPSTS